ncbi:hypothetical protein ACFBZI_04050 [Moraxella sp. ZJ142]|uniref:hypothetical protein n=1 Tax=Moraxella marmotae TaxID=3344520 RepID=UPI0035D47F30
MTILKSRTAKLPQTLALFAVGIIGAGLMACQTASRPPLQVIQASSDAHGCLTSAGFSHSLLKQQCVQLSEVADIQFADARHPSLGVFVILSTDRQFAEVFATDLPRPTILNAVKGGYLSDDSTIRLQNTNGNWQLFRP